MTVVLGESYFEKWKWNQTVGIRPFDLEVKRNKPNTIPASMFPFSILKMCTLFSIILKQFTASVVFININRIWNVVRDLHDMSEIKSSVALAKSNVSENFVSHLVFIFLLLRSDWRDDDSNLMTMQAYLQFSVNPSGFIYKICHQKHFHMSAIWDFSVPLQ